MIKISSAELMRRLRKRRKKKGLCTRCGKKANNGRAICDKCRYYLEEYKRNHKVKSEPVIIRDLKKWDITNRELYDELIEQGITIKEFAEKVGVTPRSVEAWVFEGVEPRYKDRKATVNQILNKRIYDI